MHIPFLILAQVITAYIYPPDEYGGHMADIRIEKSMPDPLLSYSDRLTESTKIGQAARTGQVYDPFSGQTMIKTQAPPSPHYNMSYEDAARRRAIEGENLAREVNTRSAELKQKESAMDYKYRLSEIEQSEKYLERIPTALDPNHPDYLTHRAQLDAELPIGGLTAAVQNKLSLLDKTYESLTKNKDLLSRHALEQEAKEAAALRKQEISQGRNIMAKYGGEDVANYEDLLAKDPTGSPLAIAARAADAGEQRSRISQLVELNVDPKQFYTPGVNGEATFDIRRADAFIKTYPTTSQAHQAAAAKDRIRQNNIGKYEDWTPDVQADYDLYDEQVQRYRSLSKQAKEEKAAPAVKSIDDFFGK